MTAEELRSSLSDPVTKREIANVMGVGIQTVYTALHRGQIPCHVVGKRRYIVPRERFIRWYLGLGESDAAASQ